MTIRDNPESITHADAAASRHHDLRSRQGLERALPSRESEARLQKIVDIIPTMVWCELPDGSNEFVNERWLEYVGVFPEQAQAWSWRAATHPEDLQGEPVPWEELRRRERAARFEARPGRYAGGFRGFLSEPNRNGTKLA